MFARPPALIWPRTSPVTIRLLKLINAAAAAGQGGKSESGRTKRPIICICNDQFAPVLKPLRQVARVFEFKQTRTSQLVARLQYICKCEHLRVAASTLHKLVRTTVFEGVRCPCVRVTVRPCLCVHAVGICVALCRHFSRERACFSALLRARVA